MQDDEQKQSGAGPAGFLEKYIFDSEAEPPADEPIFVGLLSLGDLVVWVGKEKHRKSNLLLQCAICAALGRDFLSFHFAASQPQKVVLVDYESKNTRGTFWQRHSAICQAMGLTDEDKKLLKANLKVVLVREYYKKRDSLSRVFLRRPQRTRAITRPKTSGSGSRRSIRQIYTFLIPCAVFTLRMKMIQTSKAF